MTWNTKYLGRVKRIPNYKIKAKIKKKKKNWKRHVSNRTKVIQTGTSLPPFLKLMNFFIQPYISSNVCQLK